MLAKAKSALNIITDFANRTGASVRPFESEEQLSQLSDAQATELYDQIAIYMKIYNDIRTLDQEPVVQDKTFLINALRELELSPTDDIDKYVNGSDIVEVYTAKGKQLYRNLTFLKYCSYDLVSLYTKTFDELYDRPQDANEKIFEAFGKAFQSDSLFEFNIPPHFIKEKYLDQKKVFKIDLKVACPLMNKEGDITAVLTTNHCTEYKISQVN